MKDLGRGGGQVVSVLAFYSDDPSSNPADACSFFCKKFWLLPLMHCFYCFVFS